MAKYKLLERAFIHQRLWEAGETVTVDDDVIPGPHMVPLDAADKRAFKKTGFENGPQPNYSDQITSIGVSPQDVKSGILASD
jgi:hypothetical protein